MQSHSHVNMSTSPSAVDLTHQEKILSQLSSDMFYIFMIWNKKMEHTAKIFDLKNNTLYENKDIDVVIGNNNIDIKGFVDTSKKLVEKRCYQYNSNYSSYNSTSQPAANKTEKENKKSDSSSNIIKVNSGWKSRAMDRLDEYEDGYEDYYQSEYGGYPYDDDFNRR